MSGSALGWFSSEAGQGLLAVEEAAMLRVLAGCPAAPWAWLGVDGAPAPEVGGRGLLLRRFGLGFHGAVRCRLPLPVLTPPPAPTPSPTPVRVAAGPGPGGGN